MCVTEKRKRVQRGQRCPTHQVDLYDGKNASRSLVPYLSRMEHQIPKLGVARSNCAGITFIFKHFDPWEGSKMGEESGLG